MEPIVDATERSVIAEVRAGDSDAYAALVRPHLDLARRTALLLGADSEADDVVQTSLVKAYRSLAEFDGRRPFRPWLLRIVANEAGNAVRARRRRRQATVRLASLAESASASGSADDRDDPAQRAISVERRAELLAALDTLGATHRRVIVCRYLLELDEQETATVLGWPRGTVKSRLHRALGRLRRQLEATAEAGREEDDDAR